REDEPENKKLIAYIVPQQTIISPLISDSTILSSTGDPFSVLTGDKLPSLTETLKNHLERTLPNYMIPSFFIYINKVPLTSNGKIDRKSLPAPAVSNRQVANAYIPPQTTLQQELSSIWSEVLRIEKIGIHDNFFRIGGDSIISIQLVSKARSKGIYFAVKNIFSHPTIAQLSSIAKLQEDDSLTLKPDQGVMTGDVPLTPIQHWFFEQSLYNKNHYNQAVLLIIYEKVDLSLLNKTFSHLLSHHDALRLRYTHHTCHHWRQKYLDVDQAPICLEVDLSDCEDNEIPIHIERECDYAQQSLDIECGPIIKTVLFNCGSQRPQRLFIVIHHLMVDGVSWRIFLEDLERMFSQLAKGEDPVLPPKTHSYQQWASALQHYANSQTLQEEIPYWQSVTQPMISLPVDFNLESTIEVEVKTIILSLPENETTALLQQVPKAYRTEINDILLTALVLAIGDWTQQYTLTLSLEGHGRENIIKDIDLSRTIGWFTSVFPVHLSINDPNDLGQSIKTVKENLRHIPHKGIGYGILSYLTSNSPILTACHPSLSFNYLGQWDTITSPEKVFTFAQESTGLSSSDKNHLIHLLEINAEVKAGVLNIFWTYSKDHYYDQTIKKLSHAFITRLQQLIYHCCQDHNFGYTPSDF
ncbi:MAG: non-ribosomal peptide synthetase, partial [Alphaproteobacteria bacterium]|nr:non-ribosomal peptide synthetase [Alphaproteobacteria bacterium]